MCVRVSVCVWSLVTNCNKRYDGQQPKTVSGETKQPTVTLWLSKITEFATSVDSLLNRDGNRINVGNQYKSRLCIKSPCEFSWSQFCHKWHHTVSLSSRSTCLSPDKTSPCCLLNCSFLHRSFAAVFTLNKRLQTHTSLQLINPGNRFFYMTNFHKPSLGTQSFLGIIHLPFTISGNQMDTRWLRWHLSRHINHTLFPDSRYITLPCSCAGLSVVLSEEC